MRLFTVSFLFVWSICLSAQTTAYNPQLLIPYHDHGKWGHCDTLGEVRIQPNYLAVDFFKKVRIGSDKIPVASVRTEHGHNFIDATGELIFPAICDVKERVRLSPAIGTGYLVAQDGHLGIYRAKVGWHTQPVYDSISWLAHMRNVILMKHADQPTWVEIHNRTGQAKPTRIVTLSEYWHNGSISLIAQTSDERYYEILNGQLFERSAEAMQSYESLEGEMLEEIAEFVDIDRQPYQWNDAKPDASSLNVDRIIAMRDFTKMRNIESYDFNKLLIAQRGDQYGVINAKGEEILPFRYDKIEFKEDGTQAELYKNGKVGRKLFFTTYPTIEPAYDKLEYARQLFINRSWVFQLFTVEQNGQQGYLGENGVPYFDLD